jgi:hypothetical protein
MLLRELFEAPAKRAVLAFGRLNPPTVGHAKLVDAITSIEGDHYLFLSHTQKPKTDPLDFATKLKFVKQFFPGIEVGNPSVKTPVQALEFLQSKGYTDIVFVAGSDRVEGFQKLFDTYNGQPDKSGKVPFKFNSIKVISAGERDPDADDVSGMSASKMRALAAQGELNSFAQGVPDKKLAKTMYDAVRKAMGVKDSVTSEDVSPEDEDKFHNELDDLVYKYFGDSPDEEKMKKKYKEVDEKERVIKPSLSGDTKSFRGTANRLPIDNTAGAKDITKKAKRTDMPSGSYELDFDNLDKEKLKKVVAKLIPTLGHKKNEMVLKARFGLAPFEREYTFKQIADAMGVTPEVIRQREAKALRQLKHVSRSRELRPFLDDKRR